MVIRSIGIFRLLPVTLAVIFPCVVLADRDFTKSQPDRVDFGAVRVGATIEGSVMVYEDGDDASKVKVDLESPEFVSTKIIRKGAKTYGKYGSKVNVEIGIVMDASKAGEFKGELIATIGGRRVPIQISATILAPMKDSRRVLVAETPFVATSTSDASLFDPWRQLVRSAELNVDYLMVDGDKSVLRDLDLSGYDVILLGQGGVYWIKEPDIARLNKYLFRGGRVIVTANHFFSGMPAKANKITSTFGLEMTDTERGGLAGYIELGDDDIKPHPLTQDVGRLRFRRASPIMAKDPMNGKILVAAPSYEGQGYVAFARAGKGEVVMLGQSLWWNWISKGQAADSQNRLLLRNLLTVRVANQAKDAR